MSENNLENKVIEKNNAKIEAHRILKKDNKTKEDYAIAVSNYVKSGKSEPEALVIIGMYAANQDPEIGVELLKKANTCIALCYAGDVYFQKLKNTESAAKCYESAISKANGDRPVVIEKTIKLYEKAKNADKVNELKKKYNIDADYSRLAEN